MISLDAIIAMLILLAGLGLLLGSLSEQSKNLEMSEQNIETKISALECMAVIDGMYSNSVDIYENELNCFIEKGKVKAKRPGFEKIVSVIPKVKMEHFLEVETVDHYK